MEPIPSYSRTGIGICFRTVKNPARDAGHPQLSVARSAAGSAERRPARGWPAGLPRAAWPPLAGSTQVGVDRVALRGAARGDDRSAIFMLARGDKGEYI